MQFLRTNKNLIPVLLLAALSVYTLLTVLFVPVYQDAEAYQRAFTLPHYGAFAAVLLLLTTYFFYRQYFKLLLLLTLPLTLFGILNFLPDSFQFNFGFGDVGIGFSILGFGVVLLYYFLNKPATHAFVNQHLLPTPTPAQAIQRKRESIDQFKQNFVRQSDETLHVMLQENKVLPDALAAARELLQERKAKAASN